MSRYSRRCAMSRYSRRCASSTSPKGSTACREAVTGCGDAEVEKTAARRRRAPVSTTATSRQPLRPPPRQSPRPLRRRVRCRRRILHRGDSDAATKRSFLAKAAPPHFYRPPFHIDTPPCAVIVVLIIIFIQFLPRRDKLRSLAERHTPIPIPCEFHKMPVREPSWSVCPP